MLGSRHNRLATHAAGGPPELGHDFQSKYDSRVTL
jgi:hypothetical protein